MNMGIILLILAAFAAVVAGYLWYVSGPIDEKIKVVVPDSMVE